MQGHRVTERIRKVLENVLEADLEARTRKNRWNPPPGRMGWGTSKGEGLAHEGGGGCRARQAAPNADSWIHRARPGLLRNVSEGFLSKAGLPTFKQVEPQ